MRLTSQNEKFHLTVKSIKYTHRKVNMCAKNWRREDARNLSRFMRKITSMKQHLKGDQLNVTVLYKLSQTSSNPGGK